MHFLTDFADLAVLLPLAICIAAALTLAGWHRGAVAWAASVSGVLAVMLTLKLAFLGCAADGALSPSGHTAAGTIVYGGAAALWLRRPLGALLVGSALAAMFGVTRVAIGAHVPLEVAIGAVVGLGGIALLLRGAGPRPPNLNVRRLVPGFILLVALLHGTRLAAEPRIEAAAGWLPAAVCARLGW